MLNKGGELRSKIEDIAGDQRAQVLDFKLFSYAGKQTLRCLVDYPQGGITVDVCTKINKKIFSYLEESGILGDDYVVEINSPGLDRPLKEPKDFTRVRGRVVSLWLKEPVDDKDYIEGQVIDADKDILHLEYKGNDLGIAFSNIKLGKEKIEIK